MCLFSGRLSGASERSAAPESGPSYRPRSARQEKLFRLLLHSMFILRGGRQRCCTSEDGVHSTRTARCVVRRPCPVGTAFVHHSTSIRNRAPTPTVQAPSTSPRVPHAVTALSNGGTNRLQSAVKLTQHVRTRCGSSLPPLIDIVQPSPAAGRGWHVLHTTTTCGAISVHEMAPPPPPTPPPIAVLPDRF